VGKDNERKGLGLKPYDFSRQEKTKYTINLFGESGCTNSVNQLGLFREIPSREK